MQLDKTWQAQLAESMSQSYYPKLMDFLQIEYKSHDIYPPQEQIFSAFALTSFDAVKVVILGQDPYHQKGQANGLAFSVAKGNRVPASLVNIYKEIANDCGITKPTHGDLTSWATQGVLLLNSCMTVRDSKPNSHKGKGWEIFTDHVLTCLNDKQTPVVFVLWGNFAQRKADLITNPHHLILKSVHPSPLSASKGFFGNHQFSKTNEFLQNSGQQPINWQIN